MEAYRYRFPADGEMLSREGQREYEQAMQAGLEGHLEDSGTLRRVEVQSDLFGSVSSVDLLMAGALDAGKLDQLKGRIAEQAQELETGGRMYGTSVDMDMESPAQDMGVEPFEERREKGPEEEFADAVESIPEDGFDPDLAWQ